MVIQDRGMFPDEIAVHEAHEKMKEERWLVAYICPMGAWLVSPQDSNRTYVEMVGPDFDGVTWEEAARWVMDEKENLEEEGARAVVVYIGDSPEGGPVARPVHFPDGTVISGRGF